MTPFDWRSRLTWIGRTDSGVVRQRLYDRNITGLGYSPLDPGAAVHTAAVRGEGRQPFLYSDPHWYGLAGDGSALAYRKQLDANCARLLQPGELLMVDLEMVSPEYTRRLLYGSTGNRGLARSNNPSSPTGTQAGRALAYTDAGFRDNLPPWKDIVGAGLHVYPQCYYGDMSQADVGAVVLELVRWLEADTTLPVCGDLVHPFYDGLRVASDQRDGCWFTAERIPGVFNPAARTTASASRVAARMTKAFLRAHYTQLAQAA